MKLFDQLERGERQWGPAIWEDMELMHMHRSHFASVFKHFETPLIMLSDKGVQGQEKARKGEPMAKIRGKLKRLFTATLFLNVFVKMRGKG